MAIARDAFTNGSYIAASSLTYAHTCTGSNRILFVGTMGDIAADNITGVTYSGVAMTKMASQQASTGRWHQLWYLIAPSTGSNNVVVSGGTFIASGATSYTGVSQTGFPDSQAKTSSGAASSLSQSTTVVASNCWVIGSGHSGAGAASVTAGSGESLVGTWGFITSAGFIDTNGTVATGSYTMDMNYGASDNCALIVASFAPPAVANTSNFFFGY